MRFLKASNYILTRVVVIVMILLLLMSGYFLWSNQRVYLDAEDVYNSLLKLKPQTPEEGGAPGLDALAELNPDIIGWISIDGTKIDYPVLQGGDNLYYMNRDFYGNPSLAGSIFLDTRNSRYFSDPYSLIYGHHMDNNLMFGDLDLFKDETFFRDHFTGTLMTLEEVKEMNVLAVLVLSDSTQEIFNPTMWEGDLSGLATFIRENAIFFQEESLESLDSRPDLIQVIALVTCSSGHTGERTVLLMITDRTDTPTPDTVVPDTDEPDVPAPPPQTGDVLLNSPVFWLAVLLLSAVIFAVAYAAERRKKKSDQKRSDKEKE